MIGETVTLHAKVMPVGTRAITFDTICILAIPFLTGLIWWCIFPFASFLRVSARSQSHAVMLYQTRKELNCHWIAVLLLLVGGCLLAYSLLAPAEPGVGADALARPDAELDRVPTPLSLLEQGQPLPLPRDELDAPVASAPGANPRCRWKFVQYTPSDFERVWRRRFAEIDAKMCLALWNDPEFKPHAMDFAKAGDDGALSPEERVPQSESAACGQWAGRNNSRAQQGVLLAPPAPRVLGNATFSRLEYQLDCGGQGVAVADPGSDSPNEGDRRVSYLEPLAGPLRHVRACRADRHIDRADYDRQLLRRDWLATDTWSIHRNGPFVSPFHRPRHLFFDLSASPWSSHGVNGAVSSQNWFHALYAHRHCAPFDRLFAWAKRSAAAPEVPAGRLPGPIAPRYHWVAKPVSADPHSWDNPLNFVLQEATEGDFVVLKLDLHAATLENALVEQILKHPSLAARVDELFLEQHVGGEFPPHRQEALLDLLARLRRAGIRAHSWV